MDTDELRIRKVISVLLGGRILGPLANLTLSCAPGFALASGWLRERFIGRGADVVSFVLAAFAVVYVVSTFRAWWKQRNDLRRTEHRMILGLLVVLTSTVLGIVNFAIYALDNSAFTLEPEAASWVKQRNDDLARDAQHARDVAAWCRSVLVRVEALPAKRFSFKKKWSPFSLQNGYPVDVPLGDVRIVLTVARANKDIPFDNWSAEISEKSRSVVVNAFRQPGADAVLKPPDEDGVSKEYLVNLLRFRTDWEIRYSSQLAAGRRPTLPAVAFIYQSLMTVLGDNPKYVSPNSTTTRTLALGFAIAKYLYVAVLVALVVDRVRTS